MTSLSSEFIAIMDTGRTGNWSLACKTYRIFAAPIVVRKGMTVYKNIKNTGRILCSFYGCTCAVYIACTGYNMLHFGRFTVEWVTNREGTTQYIPRCEDLLQYITNIHTQYYYYSHYLSKLVYFLPFSSSLNHCTWDVVLLGVFYGQLSPENDYWAPLYWV